MKKLKENSDDKKEIKEARIHIRTTTTKKELLQAKAKAYEMNLSDFLIAAGLGLKIKQANPEINKSLYVELCRQGNNLNQLTRLQNTLAASGKDSTLDLDDQKTLKDLRTLLEKILTKLEGETIN
ncbi:MAG: hypothetical protein QNJ55_21165 [Xenococcus sp. MO_188.B8]|nr:hypothetical protein [Xenococcus sp. MO_188.B8]